MVRDTVAFLRAEGRRVFLDCEHFFDGYKHDRDYGVRVLDAARRGGRRRRRPVRHERRHAADGRARHRQRRTPAYGNPARHPHPGRHRLRGGQHAGRGRRRCHARPGHRERLRRTCRKRRHLRHHRRAGDQDGPRRLPPGCLPRWCASRTRSPRSPTWRRTPTSRTSARRRSRTRRACTRQRSRCRRSCTTTSTRPSSATTSASSSPRWPDARRSSSSRASSGVDVAVPARRRRQGGRAGQAARGRGVVLRGGRRVVRTAAARRTGRGAPEQFTVESYRVIVERREDGDAGQRGHREGARRRGAGDLDRGGQRPGQRAGPRAAFGARARPIPRLADFELIDYKVRILPGKHGTDAVTRVLVETSDHHREWTTVGVHGNVIEASWLALHDAVRYGLLGTSDRTECPRHRTALRREPGRWRRSRRTARRPRSTGRVRDVQLVRVVLVPAVAASPARLIGVASSRRAVSLVGAVCAGCCAAAPSAISPSRTRATSATTGEDAARARCRGRPRARRPSRR